MTSAWRVSERAVTLGIVLPAALLLTAIVASFSLLPHIRKMEEQSLTPGNAEMAGKAQTLKLVLAADYVMAVGLYVYLNHFSDIGAVELF